jgi:hypothetical protein
VRHDKAPGERVGDGAAVVAADEVEAQVEADGFASRREYVAVSM